MSQSHGGTPNDSVISTPSKYATKESHGGTNAQIKGRNYLNSLEHWKGVGGFDLSNMLAIMDKFGNPQDKVPSIHVTGTNGKGSVSVFAAAILAADRYKVGLNISPHLSNLNERIILNGLPISYELLYEYADSLRRICEKIGIKPTFHEGMTALSFITFAELKLDFQVIEVGLGGRLDSTNIIKKPEVAVITNISLDHREILGDSLIEIAREKAGIIKKNCNLVVGAVNPEIAELVSSIAEKNLVKSYRYAIEYGSKMVNGSIVFQSKDMGSFEHRSSLKGEHQVENSSIAIQSARILGISEQACISGTTNAFWPGRLEHLKFREKEILLDCAHNEAGAGVLKNYLAKELPDRQFETVFGALDTKSWQEMVKLLLAHVKSWNILEPDSFRKVSGADLKQFIKSQGGTVNKILADQDEALELFKKNAGPFLVTGSIYMVGKVRPLLIEKDKQYWETA
jgi:dihydrofolate synthase/folylpolyglutamate synthase